VTHEVARLRENEQWIAFVRLIGLALALFEVGSVSRDYPGGHEAAAWAVTGAFAVGAAVLVWAARVPWSARQFKVLGLAALAFDSAIVAAYMWVFTFENGAPALGLLNVVVVEASFRFGVLGGVGLALASVPYLAALEWWRADRFAPLRHDVDFVVLPAGLAMLIGLIVGWLVERLRAQRRIAEARALEAEALRDELGRRADLVDAANRCARALASSLDLEEAFAAFLLELETIVPAERVTIVLAEEGSARVMAVAGAGADTVFPAGTVLPLEGTLLEGMLQHGEAVYRARLEPGRYPIETEFVTKLDLGCRMAAPLYAGERPIGMLSLARAEAASFTSQEIELVDALGRFVGSAVQNIRAYEAERRTVEELRSLSALRADFVSLVSHELRSPMAAVIGSAKTLNSRWEEMTSDQRTSFISLIADETSRLATLIGDVLDTSRIEAGTFTYTFRDVSLDDLVRDAAAAATAGARHEVSVDADVPDGLPPIRGDADRLRQVLSNLIENAVKYSPQGNRVVVRARTVDADVVVAVADRGPGIPLGQQRLIFEKFGRASHEGSPTQPGTGLGLYISRAIAEAHGGSLDVSSRPGEGATFTLSLPSG
jgi:signal transduction histidine kinase